MSQPCQWAIIFLLVAFVLICLPACAASPPVQPTTKVCVMQPIGKTDGGLFVIRLACEEE